MNPHPGERLKPCPQKVKPRPIIATFLSQLSATNDEVGARMGQSLSGTRLAVVAAMVALAYVALLPMLAYDLLDYLIPWLRAMLASDGLAVMGTGFTNYTGGYVSVLWAWSHLEPLLGEILVIKAAALTGTAACAFAFWTCLKSAGVGTRDRAFGTIAFCALPSVALNGAGLGQADAFYTAACLISVAAILRERPFLAGLAFAVAISFKLQAVFLAPFLAGLMLRDWRACLLSALALVPAYLAVNGIYLAGGRPLSDVLMIYAGQSGTYGDVWMKAANPWFLIQLGLGEARHDALYPQLVSGGVALGLGAAIATAACIWVKRPATSREIVFWATLPALLLPFLLPKMHDRYFFLGEVLVVLLALIDKRFWPAAILAQGSAIFAYNLHFDTLGLKAALGENVVASCALCLMVATLMTFLRAARGRKRDAARLTGPLRT